MSLDSNVIGEQCYWSAIPLENAIEFKIIYQRQSIKRPRIVNRMVNITESGEDINFKEVN